jgi:uncharacterized protein (DUF58 family)
MAPQQIPIMSDLLTPELLRRLEQFQLLAARRTKSSAKGERRSKARGQSVEFADHRNYALGDDLRYLDWNLYARLDRLFLKLYEEERELPVTVFLDCSESMSFGEPRKFDFARQIAAAVGYVALCGFDRVSIVPFPEIPATELAARGSEVAIRGALRSVRGRKTALEFFKNLHLLVAKGTANLNESLRLGAMAAKQVGVAVVLSDFLDPAGYESGITALLGRGFQVNAIQILSPEEINPSTYGDLRLIDSETGGMQEVTFGRYRLSAYQKMVSNFCQRLAEYCASRGVASFMCSSGASLEELLLKQLRQSEIWG